MTGGTPIHLSAMSRGKLGLAIGLGLLLSACGGFEPGPRMRGSPATGGTDEVSACRQVFAAIGRAVDAAAVADAEAARIEGLPYLRINRFLASFRHDALGPEAEEAWLDRLAELDRQARSVELANLPPDAGQRLRSEIERISGHPEDPLDSSRRCTTVLRRHDFADTGEIESLRRAAYVPDHYAFWPQLIGLYPVSAVAVAAGFESWKAAFLAGFPDGAQSEPRRTAFEAYLPHVETDLLRQQNVAAIIAASRRNPLGIPEPSGRDLITLIETFAPVWQVERATDADVIGRPVWRAQAGRAVVDLDLQDAVAFARLSHTRFGPEILPQISFAIWFRERPRTGGLDLLGGRLDGVIWRVTIGSDGRPVVYDTIHPCGCYHLFFPVPPVRRIPMPEDRDLREEALVPMAGPERAEGQRVIVRLTAGSHYVSAVIAADPEQVSGSRRAYVLLPPDDVPNLALRAAALPPELGSGSRSLFDRYGLIAGTERLERLLLWPMGIASPGAMRQWGTHATAFVGRRHFDDPNLLDRAFAR